jgi:CDP-paratose 2-epimerase
MGESGVASNGIATTAGARARPILITGGAGFIGVNLADRLICRGHHVTILDNLSRRGTDKNVAWLESMHGDDFDLIVGDIRDATVCAGSIRDAEVIYHLAGQTAVTTSITDPATDFDINALGTFNLLEAARRCGHDPIVLFSSTNKVYGGMEELAVVETETGYVLPDLSAGIDESRPLDFHSPYGCSKGAADQYVRDYARIYGLPTIVFRQSCVYGPRQMGVEDQGWLAWFIIAAVSGRPLTIYGNGKQVRDVLYVDDLLDALEAAVDRIEVTAGEVYNIGGGPQRAISIWQEFKPLLEAALGHEVAEPDYAETRPGDQPIFIADTTKATRNFGWEPRVTPAEGIALLAEWASANRSLFT